MSDQSRKKENLSPSVFSLSLWSQDKNLSCQIFKNSFLTPRPSSKAEHAHLRMAAADSPPSPHWWEGCGTMRIDLPLPSRSPSFLRCSYFTFRPTPAHPPPPPPALMLAQFPAWRPLRLPSRHSGFCSNATFWERDHFLQSLCPLHLILSDPLKRPTQHIYFIHLFAYCAGSWETWRTPERRQGVCSAYCHIPSTRPVPNTVQVPCRYELHYSYYWINYLCWSTTSTYALGFLKWQVFKLKI